MLNLYASSAQSRSRERDLQPPIEGLERAATDLRSLCHKQCDPYHTAKGAYNIRSAVLQSILGRICIDRSTIADTDYEKAR